MSMQTTIVTCHGDFAVGEVDERIFGGFLEHIGRAVYEGVYDPTCKHADENGFRRDVLEACAAEDDRDAISRRELRQRLPLDGRRGAASSAAHACRNWPGKASSPTTSARMSTSTSAAGMKWTPMLTVNLGTGSPEEAGQWVQYCNSAVGTRLADMRAANGHAAHDVKLWCLGNEMDGAWQIGHVPADQYAIRAQQAAKIMKDVDRTLELVAGGSCGTFMPTYMEWDRVVLEYLGDLADYVSLHRYVGNPANDTPDFLAVTNSIDQQIEQMDAVCRFVQAKGRRKKRPYLCFDEWNIWYRVTDGDGAGNSRRTSTKRSSTWRMRWWRRGSSIAFCATPIACTSPTSPRSSMSPRRWLSTARECCSQSIFHPFEMFSRRHEGLALRPAVKGPTYEGKTNGRVHTIDASAVLGDGLLHVFLTNRDLTEKARVKVQFNRKPRLATAN